MYFSLYASCVSSYISPNILLFVLSSLHSCTYYFLLGTVSWLSFILSLKTHINCHHILLGALISYRVSLLQQFLLNHRYVYAFLAIDPSKTCCTAIFSFMQTPFLQVTSAWQCVQESIIHKLEFITRLHCHFNSYTKPCVYLCVQKISEKAYISTSQILIHLLDLCQREDHPTVHSDIVFTMPLMQPTDVIPINPVL